MAKGEDSKIETTLRSVVREAVKAGEGLTISVARERTERKLGLEDKYLKGDAWRKRSKAIIEKAIEEPEEDAQQSEKVKEKAPKSPKKSKKGDEQGGPAAEKQAKAATPTPKPPQKTAPQVNGVKRKASETKSSSGSRISSSAESGTQPAEQSPNKRAKVAVPAASKETSDGEQAVSSSGSEESSEEGGESDDNTSSDSENQEADELPLPTKEASPGQDETIRPVPSKTFRPPTGYTAIDATTQPANGLLSDSDLEGKQLWHITAPSNVPISSLTELALSSITSGEPVVSQNDVSYMLSEDKTVSMESTAILAPTREGYRKLQPRISRTLHLQQKIDLPNLSALQASQMAGSNAAGDVAQAAVSTVRPQPKGLRMRYKPPGFGKGRPGKIGSASESGDEQDEEGAPSFQFPKTLGQHGVEVRQTGDVEMVDAAEVEANDDQAGKAEKKGKRKRKEKGGKEDEQQPRTNGISKADATEEASAHAGLSPDGNEAEKESKEEKRRRKEERRARKEAKARAKEAAV